MKPSRRTVSTLIVAVVLLGAGVALGRYVLPTAHNPANTSRGAKGAFNEVVPVSVQLNRSCERNAYDPFTSYSCIGGEINQLDAQMTHLLSLPPLGPWGSAADYPQVAWQKYEQQQCTSIANGFRTGTIYPSILQGCHLDLTIGRVSELKTLLSDFAQGP